MGKLTVGSLRMKWPGKDRWLTDGGRREHGRLVARITRAGVIFYFQHFMDGRKHLDSLGSYDESGRTGLSLREARERVLTLSAACKIALTARRQTKRSLRMPLGV